MAAANRITEFFFRMKGSSKILPAKIPLENFVSTLKNYLVFSRTFYFTKVSHIFIKLLHIVYSFFSTNQFDLLLKTVHKNQ